jgi:receptor-binding and translocation channel-forming TcA subunit of Tc toxin/ABC toxin-like protein/neuraminidase-like protein/putative peptidoglycan binding protein
MQLQARNLSVRMTGDDVRLLQSELRQLGYSITDTEAQQGFGQSTHAAVTDFQKKHGLPVTGIVDQGTAASINHEVDALSLTFTVHGVVRHPDGKPVTDVIVAAFDKDLRSEEQLGELVTPDAEGRYEIKYSAGQFSRAEKKSADLSVRVYKDQQLSPPSLAESPIIFNAQPVETVHLVFDNKPFRGPAEFDVLLADIAPVLDAYQLRPAQLNEDDIKFLSSDTGQPIERLNFLVTAHQLQNETRLPAEVYYGLFRNNLPTTLTSLLAQGEDAWRFALDNAIEQNIVSTKFTDQLPPAADLSPTDRVIAELRRLIGEQALKPPDPNTPSLSSLLSLSIPQDKHTEFLTTFVNHKGPVEEFWKKLSANPNFKDSVSDLQFTLQLHTLTNGHQPLIRQIKNTGRLASLKDLTKLDVADWKRIVSQRNVGLPAGVPGKTFDEQTTNYATAMTRLIERAFPTAFVANRIAADDLPGKDDLVRFFQSNQEFDLTAIRFASYVAENPEALKGITNPDLLSWQISAIQRLYKIAPSYAQASVLMKDGLHSAFSITRLGQMAFVINFGTRLGGPAAARIAYATAEQIAATALNLLAQFGMGASKVSLAVAPDKPVGSETATPERLRARGATDASDAAAQSIGDWSTLFGPLDLCECEHCRSIYGPAAYFVDALHFLRDRHTTITTGGETRDKTAKDALFERRPDLGEIELTCENTNTLLPYVDLVNEVLENAISSFGPFTPLTLPTAFSNDLNTRTVSLGLQAAFTPRLQHATITVKKLGEWWTIDDTAFTYNIRMVSESLSVLSRSLQTRGPAQERAASPQYVNPNAYNILREAVYPWTLPFDLWLEETRAYLRHLGVERHEVMETFLPGDRSTQLTNDDIAGEYLGLSKHEARLITGSVRAGEASPQDWRLWGFGAATLGSRIQIPDPADSTKWILSGNWFEVIGRVDIFLQQSGLSYQEMLEVLGTDYVNPADGGVRPIQIQSTNPDEPDTCVTSSLQLVGLNEHSAVKISRFVRLQRKLGWTARDLDKALTALIPPTGITSDISDQRLRQLSHVKRLQTALNLPVDGVLAFFSTIDVVSYVDYQTPGQPVVPSLYERLFRNRSVINPLDLAFTQVPGRLAGRVIDHVPAITAALGISAADFDLLHATHVPDDLNLDSLSHLYRHTTLAKALRLKTSDYLSSLDLLGTNPFASTHETVLFVERIAKMRESGFSIAELDYLLRHKFQEAARIAPPDEEVSLILDEIRKELQKVAAENTFRADPSDPEGMTTDPDGETIRKKLALLNWDSDLIDQAIALLGGTAVFETLLTSLPSSVTLPNDTGNYEASLMALPERFVFPSTLNEVVRYDTAAHKLQINRRLTHPEQRALLAASTDGDYVTAVNDLIKAQDDLQGEISHDPVKHVLRFVGAMTTGRRDRILAASSPSESEFQRAVEALFDMPRSFVSRNMQAFVTPDTLRSMFDAPSTPEHRFNLVLQKLMEYLRSALSTQTIKQKLGEALKLESKTADELLTKRLHLPGLTDPLIAKFIDTSFADSDSNVSVSRSVFADQFKAFTLLHKAALIISRFQVTPKQLDWLFFHHSEPEVTTTALLDFNSLPLESSATADFAAFERLADLFRLRDQLPDGESLLTEILTGATAALLERLSERTQWNLTDLQFLAGRTEFNLASPNDFKDERNLVRLRACFVMLKRLGMTAQLCRELSGPTALPESLTQERDREETVARSVRQAVRAKYDEAEWTNIAKPLQDVLREKQRQALVAYLVTHPGEETKPAWRDVNGLYNYYLIDVEMSPCQLTSRIKQAISSVQLFVQRCLMNLESDVWANAEVDNKWREWKWMKNYRVWEANRKIFLYPENWIEPELRDDKSPFFKELENELLQNDLTLETAETAFVHYLEKLDAVANLEIVGMYHQVEEPEQGHAPVDVLHVFGRTRGTPHIYYYRRRVDSASWTAWEKVDPDIAGDHLIPVVWNRRLYLFWPIFTEENVETDASVTVREGEPIPAPAKQWKIQLAWSERKQGKWVAKKISTNFGSIPQRIFDVDERKSGMLFRSHLDNESNLLTITLIRRFFVTVAANSPLRFEFEDCGADPIIQQDPRFIDVFAPFGTGVMSMSYVEEGDRKLMLPVPAETEALAATPGTFRLLPPHEGSRLDAHPFFYSDNTRTFFITPERVPGVFTLPARDSVIPAASTIHPDSFYPAASISVIPNPIDPIANPLDPALFDSSFPRATDAGSFTTPGIVSTLIPVQVVETRYRFQTFYYPYVDYFVRELNRHGVDGLLQRSVQMKEQPFFDNRETGYGPTSIVVRGFDKEFYPRDDVDFSYGGAYSQYNWELFFHAPLLIADRLSKNQRFEEAQKWFHYIFDPTDTSNDKKPQGYWRTKPFFKTTSNQYHLQNIPNLLHYLSNPRDAARLADLTGDERRYLNELPQQVEEWRNSPFKPHLIARMRTTAYQKTVVMKYLDNLIAWGDQLFRRDTLESINEATQLYVLAAEILGRRPDEIPPRAVPEVQSFNTIEPKLDAFSNALVRIEEFVPPSAAPAISSLDTSDATTTLPTMLYFCVPKNDKLLGCWDTVADRLFKIRHCMNIEGVVRQLPLFEPPIDPALLVKAAAAGVDISSALSDVSATLSYYRFNVMAQKASELCAEVKALGGALLSALEKRDAEALSLLRSTHEINLLNAARQVKEKQLDEAKENIEGLKKSRELAKLRLDYYRTIEFLNAAERKHLALGEESITLQTVKAGIDLIANTLFFVPDVKVGGPFTIGATMGGQFFGNAIRAYSASLGELASIKNATGSLASTYGGYQRRFDDWKLQERLAAKEIEQIDRQLAAAQIRLAVAEQDLKNHDLQTENAQAVDEVMRNKFTNRELYDWMVGQVSTIYFQSYQLAYDVAKRAERAFRHELGLAESNYIQFGYWDSLKKGLLAGERLYHDIKRLEVAYLDQNRREYEITRHISLALLDPLALVKLRENGECFVDLHEVLFDMDYPGHYVRRIKSVGLTIPCVVGPYTGINCTLTLLANSLRRTTAATPRYARNLEGEDPRFADNVIPIQSIATSSGQNDSGMFELNFHDERYLPFEGAGAISSWRIEMPRECNQFDFKTISDVVLHLRYTARDGGQALKNEAMAAVVRATPSVGIRLFSMRHEFASEWHKFMNPTAESPDQQLKLSLTRDHFPFVAKEGTHIISGIDVFLLIKDRRLYLADDSPYQSHPLSMSITQDGGTTWIDWLLERNPSFGGLPHRALTFAPPPAIPFDLVLKAKAVDVARIPPELQQPLAGSGAVSPRLKADAIEDILVICHYAVS